MYGRLMFCATALLFASALPSEAQTRAGARTAPPIRFQEMDRNNDRVVTRAEWQGSDESFRQNDWNGDGILSGEEVRLDANERARGRDDFASDAPEYGFNDWTPRQFAALDRNHDGRIARKEWRLDRELFVASTATAIISCLARNSIECRSSCSPARTSIVTGSSRRTNGEGLEQHSTAAT